MDAAYHDGYSVHGRECVPLCFLILMLPFVGGVMESLDHRWIGVQGDACVSEVVKSPDRLGLSSMRDLFVLLSVSLTLGAILSALEVTHGRQKCREA